MNKFKKVMLSIGLILAMLICVACAGVLVHNATTVTGMPVIGTIISFVIMVIEVMTISAVIDHITSKRNVANTTDKFLIAINVMFVLTTAAFFAIDGSYVIFTMLLLFGGISIWAFFKLVKWIDAIQDDYDDAHSKIEMQEAQAQKDAEEIKRLSKELGDANGTMHQQRLDIETNEALLHEKEKDLEDAKTKLDTADKEYAQLKLEKAELQQQINEGKASEDLIKKNEELLLENVKLKAQIAEYDAKKQARNERRRANYAKKHSN